MLCLAQEFPLPPVQVDDVRAVAEHLPLLDRQPLHLFQVLLRGSHLHLQVSHLPPEERHFLLLQHGVELEFYRLAERILQLIRLQTLFHLLYLLNRIPARYAQLRARNAVSHRGFY